MRYGILTASDMGARGERQDASATAIRDLVIPFEGAIEAFYAIVPDEAEQIAERIRHACDTLALDLLLTTGGTGLSPRDVTPDVTAELVDYQVPGMAEAMRAEGLRHTPMAMLSRAVVGVRGRTLVVNLPGSPKGVRENLAAILTVLPHAVGVLRSSPTGRHS